MKFTARQTVGFWIKKGINLAGVERVLGLGQGTLRPLYETQGPAPIETEILLNMVHRVPVLLEVAEENFNMRQLVEKLFKEWTESQGSLSKLLESKG